MADVEFWDSMIMDSTMERVRLFKEIREIEETIEEFKEKREKARKRELNA